MPKLELISRFPAGRARPVPLLFIHGAFCSAPFWDVHMLPYAAERGFAAHAISLRGHGRSEGRGSLAWTGLNDYVEDVAATIRDLGTTPVLVGHSMGGFVVQRYIARNPAPAAVLMASAPPHGLFDTTLGLVVNQPMLFQQMLSLQTFGAISLSAIRRAMFTDRVDDTVVKRCVPFLQEESQRVGVEMLTPGVVPPRTLPQPPVLVVGGGEDVLVSRHQVEATGRAFNTRPVIFPSLAHNLVLEDGWREVADTVLDWIDDTLAGTESELTAEAAQ